MNKKKIINQRINKFKPKKLLKKLGSINNINIDKNFEDNMQRTM